MAQERRERGEAEATAALHHLGDAVDVDELVDELAVALFTVPAAAMAAVPTFLCHILFLVLFRKHGLMMIRRPLGHRTGC